MKDQFPSPPLLYSALSSGDQLSAGINQFAIATRTKKTWECWIFWGAGNFVLVPDFLSF